GGSKLKESDLEGVDPSKFARPDSVAASGSAAGVSVSLGNGSAFTFSDGKLAVKKLPASRFADLIGRFVDRPVVDLPNLPGISDYEIPVPPEDYRAILIRPAITAGVPLQPEVQRMAMVDIGDSLATGLQALGLRLEPRKAPLDVIVVDH